MGKSEGGLDGVVGGMMVIAMLAGKMRLGAVELPRWKMI